MPQLLDWVASNFFIVIIIIGALFSVFGKKKGSQNGGGEPFGGRGAPASRPGAPAPGRQASLPEGEGERRSPFGGPSKQQPVRVEERPVRSSNRPERRKPSTNRTTLAEAAEQMNAEIERRLQKHRSQQGQSPSVEPGKRLSGNSSSNTSSKKKAQPVLPSAYSDSLAPASALFSAPTSEDLQRGILWAEVLGSPRSRKSYSSGRR